MATRANWKGFLRLSLVTCPVALYPATSDSEKVSFNQINRNTGHRIKYSRVDAETGEEVASEDIVKAFKIDTDTYVEVSKEELENVTLESTRTIEIDEFVARDEIDPRYIIRPYYLRPDGKVGHDAFAVIREGGAEPAKPSKPAKKPRKAASGQKEMLMPIAGKKAKETTAKKPTVRPQRKSA
jgi:DNA end-binding protein Ku